MLNVFPRLANELEDLFLFINHFLDEHPVRIVRGCPTVTLNRDMLLSFPQRDKSTPSKLRVEVTPLNPATMLDALLLDPGGFKFA